MRLWLSLSLNLFALLTVVHPAAHVHHAWETYLAGGRTRKALVQGVLQSSASRLSLTLFPHCVEGPSLTTHLVS